MGSRLGDELRAALPGVPLWIGNDAAAACWGEYQLGAGRGSSDMIMVTLGTGIGGGVVVRGGLVEGGGRFAGEVGHVVVDPSGPECPCGRRGCWERFAFGEWSRSSRPRAGGGGEAPQRGGAGRRRP